MPVVILFSFRLRLIAAGRVGDFVLITAADRFRLARPCGVRQCENLQQDFCESLRWLGWRAHLCYRRRRLKILFGITLFLRTNAEIRSVRARQTIPVHGNRLCSSVPITSPALAKIKAARWARIKTDCASEIRISRSRSSAIAASAVSSFLMFDASSSQQENSIAHQLAPAW